MKLPLVLLKFVGKAVANAVGGGVAGDLLFDVVPDVAQEAYKWWKKDRKPEEQQADLLQLANAPPEEIKLAADAVAAEVSAGKSPEFERSLGVYLSLMPGAVRQSLRRPSDPAGRTVTAQQVPRSPEEFAALLPSKLPRFSVGEQPLDNVDLELEELLGVGGMGEVWKARNPLLPDRPSVALKFCLDDGAAAYLRNEAAVLSRISMYSQHPNIVTLQQTYLRAKTPCLQYEYVEGGDLAGLVKEWHAGGTPPSPLEVTRVFHKLAEVIGTAHTLPEPIVHRDLKPANVLRQLRPDGTSVLKVADFGIGGLATRHAIHEQGRPRTQASQSMFLATALRGSCTPLYAPVQQMRGDAPDPRDDVFALGVIWFQMLTGDLSNRPGGMWKKKVTKLGLDEPLADVLGLCIDDDLEDRLATAKEVADRVAALLPGGVTPVRLEAAEPPTFVAPPPRPRSSARSDPRGMVPPRGEPAEPAEHAELKHRLGKIDVLLASEEDDARAWAERGELNLQLGRYDEAIGDCTRAVQLDPDLACAYGTRAGAHRMKGDNDSCLDDATRATQLDPDNALAWFQRGEANRMKNRPDRAIADLGEAIRLAPEGHKAYGSRGAAYQRKGDYKAALADLDECLRLAPSYAWALAERGETYRLRHDYDRAIQDCNEALKVQPHLARALASRGAAYRQKGDFKTALADLDVALRLDKGNQFVRDQIRLAEQKRK